jgi:hypothetical protein
MLCGVRAVTVTQDRLDVNLQYILRSFGAGNVGVLDVKRRDLGPGVAEAVLDLPGVDELAKIDGDRYTWWESTCEWTVQLLR